MALTYGCLNITVVNGNLVVLTKKLTFLAEINYCQSINGGSPTIFQLL
jgi:hypothetical protein